MRHVRDFLIALLIPFVVVLHLFAAPYTKVEESFNVQATHDLITYGIPLKDVKNRLIANYDHMTFPGSVPRTFVGPLALALVSWPFASLAKGVEKQVLVRAVLGLYNAFCILAYRNGVARLFSRNTANWYILLQASQFHILYYSSRTLPNFFAFGLTVFALRNLLPPLEQPMVKTPNDVRRRQHALVLLTLVGIVFRSEIAILLGTHTLWLLFTRRLRLDEVVYSGLIGALLGLSITVPLDSFLWQKPFLWPEFSGFIFNVLHGQSSNWGTSPIYFYLIPSVPRLLINPLTYLVCIPLALMTPALGQVSRDILIPNMAFILIYSMQPHKEWRFIIYVIPPLTTVAALGANWIWNRRAKSSLYLVLAVALAASVLGSFLISCGLLTISSMNYPGAAALNRLHQMVDRTQSVVHVHMDTLSCMTGVTRFLEIPKPECGSLPDGGTLWLYDKTENETQLLDPTFWDTFDYVLVEKPERAIGAWEVIDQISGFTGLRLLRPGEGGVYDGLVEGERPPLEGHGFSHDETAPLSRSSWPIQHLMRRYITRGWWVRVKFTPQISILKSAKARR